MILAILQRFSKQHSRRNLYEWLEEALSTIKRREGTIILNVGSGGEIGEIIASTGLKCVSIDVDPARQPDLVMDARCMDAFEADKFDAVCVLEVLEHIPEPEVAIREIIRVLKPNGIIIGSTPFMLGIHDHPYDYYRFTKFGISHLFGSCEEISLRERNSYFESAGVICLRIFNVATRQNKVRAMLLCPLIIATFGLLRFLAFFIPSEDATTGYFFVYRKLEAAARFEA